MILDNGDALVGGEGEKPVLSGAPVSAQTEILSAFEEAAVQIARTVYPQLDKEAMKKAEKGLE